MMAEISMRIRVINANIRLALPPSSRFLTPASAASSIDNAIALVNSLNWYDSKLKNRLLKSIKTEQG